MKPVKAGKHIPTRVAVAVLMMSLIAPPIVAVCECLCASGAAIIRAMRADLSAEPVCCTEKYRTASSGDEFFHGIDTEFPCDADPNCCCAAGSGGNPTIPAAALTNAPQPTIKDYRYQEAGISAFTPNFHLFSARACFAFHKNMIPTSPHIASTILLL